MIVRLGDIINKVSQNVDRYNTPLQYYIGKGLGECGELALTEKGDLKKDVETLGYQFQFEFHKGDTLFFTKSHHLRKAGYVDFDGVCSIATFVLRSKDSSVLLPEYLPIIIHNDVFWDYCVDNESGSVNTFVRWSTLADYEFDLPSIDEQKVLADKLWAAYKVKESYRQLLFTTDEMLKAKFQEMFGDVDNNKHNFPVEALGKICECYAGATPSTEKSEYWNGGTIPWMSSGEVHKKFVTYTDAFITTEGYNHSSTKMVPIHSIVVALAGQGKTRGTVAVNEIELCTNQSLCAIVPSSTINYLYLFHNLNSRYLEIRNMAGDIAGRGGLNLKIINSIKVILPPMELQQQFAEIATQAEATKASLRASIEAIDRVIRSLINQ